MIVADEAHTCNQNAHARGVAAILKIESPPLDLFGAVRLIQSIHPLVSNGSSQVRFLAHLLMSNLKCHV